MRTFLFVLRYIFVFTERSAKILYIFVERSVKISFDLFHFIMQTGFKSEDSLVCGSNMI